MRRSKGSEGLTKDELALAQALHHTCDAMNRAVNEMDPHRRRADYLVRHLDGILAHASIAFTALVGRHWSTVHLAELSTGNPADWTRRPRTERERTVAP